MILLIFLYFLHIVLCRYIYFRICDLDDDMFPNPIATCCWFIPVFGLIILLMIYIILLIDSYNFDKDTKFNKILQYIFVPKKNR